MRRIRVAVDTSLAALFIVVMATALVQEASHEYLGVGLFAAVVAHTILNRRRFRALLRGRRSVVRTLRLMVIACLIACVVGQAGSALVLSKFAFGFLPSLPGASLARRIHMLCSYWSFALAFAHVGLHTKGLGRLMHIENALDASGVLRFAIWAGRFFFVAFACFGVYSFVKLDFGAYLLGQVQFAFADRGISIVHSLMSYASIALLIGGLFHCLPAALEALKATWIRESEPRQRHTVRISQTVETKSSKWHNHVH